MFKTLSHFALLPCIAAFLLVHAHAAAQTLSDETDVGPMITDRPDQTESSATVPPRSLQLETGVNFIDDGGRARDIEFGTTLLRIGLVEDWELRVATDGWIVQLEGNEEEGVGDGELGFKWRFLEHQGNRPEMALLAGISIPVGKDEFSSDRADPSFRLLLSHEVGRYSVGYNLGVAWETLSFGTNKSTLSTAQYTVAAGTDITDRMGAFAELFGDIPLNAPGGPAHSVDGGITYALNANVQWDVATGFGLTSEADNWFLTTGMSIRFLR